MFWITATTVCFQAINSLLVMYPHGIGEPVTGPNVHCVQSAEISTSPVKVKEGERLFVTIPKDFIEVIISITNNNLREYNQCRYQLEAWETEGDKIVAEKLKEAEERQLKSAPYFRAPTNQGDGQSGPEKPTLVSSHCIELSSPTYVDPSCHSRWVYYNRQTGTESDTFANMRYPPNCEDKVYQPCLLEEAYFDDGSVRWRRP